MSDDKVKDIKIKKTDTNGMSIKTFTVGFWTASLKDVKTYKSVHEVFAELKSRSKTSLFAMKRGGNAFVIRNIESWNKERNFKGEFCKVRLSDIPHKGDTAGNESEIDLEPNEGLIEKSHFIFTKHRDLLIFQDNHYAGGAPNLGHYLTEFSDTAVSFSPVIKSDSLKQLLKGNTLVKSIEIAIARPRNASHFPEDNFNQGLLSLLQSSDAASLNIKMNANLPGTRGGFISSAIKKSISALMKDNLAKKVRAEIETDGKVLPIDLIVDRVINRQEINMDGRYPIPADVFEALEDARKEVAEDLNDYFGKNDQGTD